jgi:hypothetical protein
MRKALAIAGGVFGAVFTGAAVWAFTEKHLETTYFYGIPVQQTVDGYPGFGSVFIVLAIVGFVVMAVGFLSKPTGERMSVPISIGPSYSCPHCGQPLDQGTPVCPKCSREIKW